MTLVTAPSEEQEARAEMTPGCKAEMYITVRGRDRAARAKTR